MAGFDYEKVRKDLDFPDEYDVMAMIAIGKRGRKENLPLVLQEREIPSEKNRWEKSLWKDALSKREISELISTIID
jgi:hypothetical protein